MRLPRKSSKSWLLLLSFFSLVPTQCSSKSYCVKQHMHRVGVLTHRRSGLSSLRCTWQALHCLPLCYSLQCVFISVSHHSSLMFWEQSHLYHQLHTFFFCFAPDFIIGSLNLGSNHTDIISPETNVPSLTLDYFSSQKLPEFLIGKNQDN